MKNYKTKTHLTYSCQYHVVFCPKYRRNILKNGIDESLKSIFNEVALKYDFEIIELEIMPNHVHLLIECNPRFGIMNCINRLKYTSANKLPKLYPELKTKLPNIWTRSAFISTVGAMSLDVVKKYIEEQKTHQ